VVRGLVVSVLILVIAITCSSQVSSAEKEQRIRLKPGWTEARVSARLTAKNNEARYILHANSGQRLTAELTGVGPLSGEVVSPSGKQEGQPGGGVFFDEQLTESGDYRIRISEGSRGEKRNVRFVLRISIR
jgi:hypothetical protein